VYVARFCLAIIWLDTARLAALQAFFVTALNCARDSLNAPPQIPLHLAFPHFNHGPSASTKRDSIARIPRNGPSEFALPPFSVCTRRRGLATSAAMPETTHHEDSDALADERYVGGA
jgi:hypothetical protein